MPISMFDVVFPTHSAGLLMIHEAKPHLIIFFFIIIIILLPWWPSRFCFFVFFFRFPLFLVYFFGVHKYVQHQLMMLGVTFRWIWGFGLYI